MDFFMECLNKEFDITMDKCSHVCESMYSNFLIKSKEIELNLLCCEGVDNSEELYMEAVKDFAKKVGETITSILAAIVDFIKQCKDSLVKAFKGDKEKLKHIDVSNLKSDTVEIPDAEASNKVLNEYIREMIKLERKLMTLKASKNVLGKGKNDGLFEVECNEILKDMNALNSKYDSKFLSANDKIIKMASKDAVRFATKELDNVSVDFDAVEKNVDEILVLMKKDAEGCESPIQANAIQVIARNIATRYRKSVERNSHYKKKTIAAVLGIAVISGAANSVGRVVGDKIANAVMGNKSSKKDKEDNKKDEDIIDVDYKES